MALTAETKAAYEAIHTQVVAVTAEHIITTTTCTCGHWTEKSWPEHLRDAVDAAIIGG